MPRNAQSDAFGTVETRLASTFNQPGGRDDWQRVAGAWVLRPPHRATPKAIVHFVGGAFVGAAPQLTYRLLLELLASKGLMIIATPFPTGFNHLAISDQTHFMFDRCMSQLRSEVSDLPIFGIGHSLGALVHLLISSRYPVQRSGNVFLSFNNKPATESLPFITPFLGPGAAAIAPIIARLAASPLTAQFTGMSDLLKSFSPAAVQQFMPLLDQLQPLYMNLAKGEQEFVPHPDETRTLVRGCYGTPQNLAIKFVDDTIDETDRLTQLLQNDAAVAATLNLTVRSLPGDHVRPLRQEVPSEVSSTIGRAAQQGRPFLDQLNQFIGSNGFNTDQIDRLANGFISAVGSGVRDDIDQLASEIARWIDIRTRPSALQAGSVAGQLNS